MTTLQLFKSKDSVPLRGNETCEYAKYVDPQKRAWILTVTSPAGTTVSVTHDPDKVPHTRVGSFREAIAVLRENGIVAVQG